MQEILYKIFLLTELVLFQRSEKGILVKMTSFCVFQPVFKISSKVEKSETSNVSVLFLNFDPPHCPDFDEKQGGGQNSNYFIFPIKKMFKIRCF